VNLVRLLEQQFGIKSQAAACIISHGQVQIDGHTVHMQWARGHWTEDQLRGRMMSVIGRGEFRILGSRIAPVYEQTAIEV
jgi:hypothetical protein